MNLYSIFAISSWLWFNISCALLDRTQSLKTYKMAAKLSSAILYISNKSFRNEVAVYKMLLTEENGDTLNQILNKIIQNLSDSWTVLTIDTDNYSSLVYQTESYSNYGRVFPRIGAYVIPSREHNELSYLETRLDNLDLSPRFNPRAIFFLVKLTSECGLYRDKNLSVEYFSALWKRNCWTVKMLVLSSCDLSLTVVTGKPFSRGSPCRLPQIEGIKHSLFSETEKLLDSDCSKRIVRDFNGCTFVASTVPMPPYVIGKQTYADKESSLISYEYVGGIEIDLLYLLSKLFNFNVKFDTTHGYEPNAWFKILKNGSSVGIGLDIRNHKVDFGFGGILTYYKTSFEYEYSPCYKYSSISFYVPSSKTTPQWELVFKAFSLKLWIFLTSLYLGIVFMYYIMNIFGKRFKKEKSCRRSIVFVEFLRLGLGMPSVLKPVDQYLRVLIVSWALFTLHISLAYSSVLFGFLTHPPFEKELSTVKDLEDAGLKVASSDSYFNFLRVLEMNDDFTTKYSLENNIECLNMESCTKTFLTNKNFSFMQKSDVFESHVNLKVSKVHKLSENMMAYGVSMMLTKGNPLRDGINNVTLRAFETGLVEKWEKDTVRKFHLEAHYSGNEEDIFFDLGLEDLQGQFILLLVGLGLAILAFIGEICVSMILIDCNCKLFLYLKSGFYVSKN